MQLQRHKPPTGAVVAYARVSTTDQHLDRQLDGLSTLSPVKTFEDRISGTTPAAERPGLGAALSFLREGDTLAVWGLDRLGRDIADMLNTIEDLHTRGVTIFDAKNSQHVGTSAQDKMLTNLLLSFAQFERELARERQAEGIAAAKKRGAYKGRKPIDSAKLEAARQMIEAGIPINEAARRSGVSRSTLYKRGIVGKAAKSKD